MKDSSARTALAQIRSIVARDVGKPLGATAEAELRGRQIERRAVEHHARPATGVARANGVGHAGFIEQAKPADGGPIHEVADLELPDVDDLSSHLRPPQAQYHSHPSPNRLPDPGFHGHPDPETNRHPSPHRQSDTSAHGHPDQRRSQ